MIKLGTRLVLVLSLGVLVLSSAGCNKLKARDQLNKGVRAYKIAQYTTAIEHFKSAIELDPQLQVARLYLATAYANQFIPGAESEENTKAGNQAIAEFKRVLQDDPNNINSVAGIASICFNMKKLDEAKTWYQKQIALDPKNAADAYYSLGVIAWTVTYPRRMEVKAKGGIRPEDPIKDAKLRGPLCDQNMPIIEQSFVDLGKAIELRPDYADAMAYLNLMWREKADCEADNAAREEDLKKAEDWVTKNMDIKKKQAAPTPPS
jgi:tetratricopeptide (TPR) repeat protein